jgi:Chromatin remodeling factor Mit1 C-terminal Zn finger 2
VIVPVLSDETDEEFTANAEEEVASDDVSEGVPESADVLSENIDRSHSKFVSTPTPSLPKRTKSAKPTSQDRTPSELTPSHLGPKVGVGVIPHQQAVLTQKPVVDVQHPNISAVPGYTLSIQKLSDMISEAKRTQTVPSQAIQMEIPTGIRPRKCKLCTQSHVPGHCPLRTVPIQQCPACGFSHVATARTCPLLRDEHYLKEILKKLKRSTEDRDIIRAAKSYVRGVLKDLQRRERK